MHRLATLQNNSQPDNVIFVEQQPAPIVIITAADTDIQTLANACDHLGDRYFIDTGLENYRNLYTNL